MESVRVVLTSRGMHAAIAGIALPNEASAAVHEKFGMRKVAHFEQTGFKFGRWVDVGYWERILMGAECGGARFATRSGAPGPRATCDPAASVASVVHEESQRPVVLY
jgi:hypothetical protein